MGNSQIAAGDPRPVKADNKGYMHTLMCPTL